VGVSLTDPTEPSVPSDEEAQLARESSQRLAAYLSNGHEVCVQITENGQPGRLCTTTIFLSRVFCADRNVAQ